MNKKIGFIFVFILCCFTAFGQIGFQEQIVYDNASNPSGAVAVYAADLDNDGNMDLISSDYYGKIYWFRNTDGQGTFGSHQTITVNAEKFESIYASDIDNDGDMDVISASKDDNKIAWYENTDGQGTFGAQQIIATLDQAGLVYAVDIDNDGDSDILAAGYSNDGEVVWYENIDGQGAFGSEQIIASNINLISTIDTADIDNDGDIDVLFSSTNDSKVVWFENTDGQGTFGTQQIIASGTTGQTSYVRTFDIDNDGDIDVFAQKSTEIVWYENTDGQGAFVLHQSVTVSSGTSLINLTDIDSDGDMDVLFYDSYNVSWFENTDGQGTFGAEQIIISSIDSIGGVFPVEIDNEEGIDLAVIFRQNSNPGYLKWYKNTDGQGTFSSQQTLGSESTLSGVSSIYTADIDNDGDLDVLSASIFNNSVAWYENTDGQGTYGNLQVINNNADDTTSVYAADLDNDGDIDVLSAAREDGYVSWYENIDGQGTFGTEQIISNGLYYPMLVYAVDIDNDGDMDVLMGSIDDGVTSSFDETLISWYENTDGQGTFGPKQTISNNDSPLVISATDIDNDGDMDVLSVLYNMVVWYENTDGQGAFGPKQIITTQDADTAYAVDIDNDGDMDVYSASENDNKIAWYENTDGQGAFSAEQIITTNAQGAISAYAADIDNDGDMDIFSITLDDDSLVWYENTDGQGTFGSQQVIATTGFNGASSLHAADINNDGNIDLLSSKDLSFSEPSEKIVWYKNLGISFNEINGEIRVDLDGNGCSVLDNTLSNIMINTNNGTQDVATFSLNNGSYQLFVDQGDFTTTISNLPNYYVSSPISQVSNFAGVDNIDTIDFCIEPIGSINDLNISVYPSINEPRPGFDATYQIIYNNVGTTQLSGNVTFEFDDAKLNFLNASETIVSQTANTLTFNFTDLNPFETRTIDLEFNVFAPPTTNINDVLVSTATVNPVTGDNTADDNVFTLNQTVIGSYDPNDIRVLEGEEILLADADKYLHYIIRFQNTGTASAINVNVENILDSKLDWTTMQLESLSHTGRVEITNGSMVKFIFDNINLPDSTSDETNSHGFIAYKIKPKTNVVIGDIFNNTADIFFDFNPAIVTNTVNTEIVNTLSVKNFETSSFSIFPNPVNNILNIEGEIVIESVAVYDINGRLLNTITSKSKKAKLDVSNLSQGLYFLEIKSGNKQESLKFIKK
ncbi:T9SS type A sorting domain-containing protein [uncultured Lacinutrix sp.]|uniref:T9SS type A sorting domain-containing protein n=1 Tax=uncultured Lacinutrix sp. TaxID=574032 RepID=UPI0026119632|nr:T9SS type A sorting domain-containing protein [uncultured Lacinutrix sp.]